MMKRPARQKTRQQSPTNLPSPDLYAFERDLLSQGFGLLAGVDEVGRGPLAGPVVAASVILPQNVNIPGLTDSKQLTKKEREFFFDVIKAQAISFAFGLVGPVEIDEINIHQASLKAMNIAVNGLSVTPDYLLVDGPFPLPNTIPQKPIKKGDSLSLSIAAASVIAKVTRDQMMCEFEQEYPQFSFSVHKGYGTAKHLDELKRHGPTPIHRMTFRGVK